MQQLVSTTVPGELYVWGSNSFGQLGLPDKRDRNPVPTLLSKEVHQTNTLHLHCLVLIYNVAAGWSGRGWDSCWTEALSSTEW